MRPRPPLFPGFALLVTSIYLLLACAGSLTKRPWEDEALYANPAYNLAFQGHMGTTVYELPNTTPGRMATRTYWQPPFHFVLTAVWFKLLGFGVVRLRLLSVLLGLASLVAWYSIFIDLGVSRQQSLLSCAFLSLDYFFQMGASDGRMDMLCFTMGTVGIAIYLHGAGRLSGTAMLAANALVVLSGLTHPMGVVFFAALAFLILYFDRAQISFKLIALGALPYLAGAALWGSYIIQDPGAFREQFLGIVNQTRQASGVSTGFYPLYAIQQEIGRRYIAAFGLGPDVPLLNRSKGIVLMAYVVGILAIICIGRLRRDRAAFTVLLMTAIYFFATAFIATSKNYYYLPFTTIPMAACLVLACLRSGWTGARQKTLYGMLALIAVVQLAGTVYRIRQDPFHRSYMPLIRAVEQNSAPGSVVIGAAGLWLGLNPDRTLIHDTTLGCMRGTKPSLVVLEPVMGSLLEEEQRKVSAGCQACIAALIGKSTVVYNDGYYTVYRPH